MKYILVIGVLISFSFASLWKPSQDCEVKNQMISPGEEVTYATMYNWGFIWLEAGEVTFKIKLEEYKGKICYRITGVGGTYPSYDWIYKVRDRFESWVDTATLKPYRYVRDVKEGGRYFYNECFFNYQTMKAFCVTVDQKKAPRLDTVPISQCAFDPMTMIFFSRTIDYSKYRYNDTIPITLFLDNTIYPLYLRYLGKEELKLNDTSRFNCIKFSPKLVEGTIFRGGEGMTVWATNDMNRIPIYVEAPILVGTVKAKMIRWRGLRNKLDSRIK